MSGVRRGKVEHGHILSCLPFCSFLLTSMWVSSSDLCPFSFSGSSPGFFYPMRKVRGRKSLQSRSPSTATQAPFLSLPPAMPYESFGLHHHHGMKEIKETKQRLKDTTWRCIPVISSESSSAFSAAIAIVLQTSVATGANLASWDSPQKSSSISDSTFRGDLCWMSE